MIGSVATIDHVIIVPTGRSSNVSSGGGVAEADNIM